MVIYIYALTVKKTVRIQQSIALFNNVNFPCDVRDSENEFHMKLEKVDCTLINNNFKHLFLKM